MTNTRWLVEFATDDRKDCQIVINAKDANEARIMLKRHMAGKPYRIKRITEWGVTDDLPRV